jgi:hypothetical protein
MLRTVLTSSSGDAALSRFATTNTWNAQQIFKGSATTTPGAIFQAFGTTSAVPAIDANGIAIFQGAEATAGHVQFSASGSTTHVVFRRNNGTYASPTALASGDVIGSLQWQGRGASTFGTVPAAQIRGVTNQAFTEAARGTNLEFYVTANGSITQALVCTMFSTVVAFPILVQATDYSITKTAGNARSVFFQTSSSNRWALIANSTAEGGSNAGTNFELRRYSDAGADLGIVMDVIRSSGNINFNTGGGTSTFTNDIIAPFLQLSRPATNIRPIIFRTSGSTRWEVRVNGGAESGSNAGSDFEIRRYSDAAADLGLVMSSTRSNGNITFNGGGGITSFAANKIQITTAQTPANSAAAGNAGDIAWDDTYLYVRQSTGWRRIALGAAF